MKPMDILKQIEVDCGEQSSIKVSDKLKLISDAINSGHFASYQSVLNLLKAASTHKRHGDIARCVEGISDFLADEHSSEKNPVIRAEQLAQEVHQHFIETPIDLSDLGKEELGVVERYIESAKAMSELLVQVKERTQE